MTVAVSTTWACDRCAIDVTQPHAPSPPPIGWVGLAINPDAGARLPQDGWERRDLCGDCFMALLGFLSGALVDEGHKDVDIRKDVAKGGAYGGSGPFTLLQLHHLGELDPDDDDYRPPSVADGTVSEVLTEAIRDLTDSFGAAGVRSVLDELFGPEPPK